MLQPEQASIGISDGHHLGAPVRVGPVEHYIDVVRPLAAGPPDAEIDVNANRIVRRLLRQKHSGAIRRYELAAVMLGLEVDLEAERLPERDAFPQLCVSTYGCSKPCVVIVVLPFA